MNTEELKMIAGIARDARNGISLLAAEIHNIERTFSIITHQEYIQAPLLSSVSINIRSLDNWISDINKLIDEMKKED